MNAKEAKAAFDALAKSIGPRALISVTLNGGRGGPPDDRGVLAATVYPFDILRESAFTVFADAFSDLFAATEAKWADHSAEHRKRTVRKMALEIIRITAEHGECTDAALRAANFDQIELNNYGSLACEQANEMASKGPFSIKIMRSHNAPDQMPEEQTA